MNYRRERALPGLWHDYANLFPMLDAVGQDALRVDVQQFGVREPVVVFQGRILDGRNRYMAARDLGLDFPVADFDGTDAEALNYVLSTNLHRRHLTESQRAAVAAKLANMRQGERTDLKPSANLQKVSQAEAADMLNVSERSVATARKVIEQGAPDLIAAVEQGSVSVSAAAVVSKLPQEEQAAVMAEGPKAVKAKAKEVREQKASPGNEPPRGDTETAKERRELAKMTDEALIDEVIGLRADLADAKAKIKAQKVEIENLKEENRLFTLNSDQGRTIGLLNKRLDQANFTRDQAMEAVKREEFRRTQAEKRVAELEAAGIPLN
ncbi:hypothetical protein ACUSIJ_24855 [Pseudochelatococcus sp. B33]